MFIAPLLTIAKLWKQPRCPTIDEWIKKMWYPCTMVFYSVTKKKEILLLVSKWMELENIILNKVRHRGPKSHVLPHMQIIDIKQIQLCYWTWITY
jgi:hypothetical protein